MDLAGAWVALHYAKKDSEAYVDNFWAYASLEELRDKDLERYWRVVNKIKGMDDSDFMLSNLAAGPLEDLLVNAGSIFIDRIEACAKEDKRFKAMLSMVWKNDIPDDIWARVERASSLDKESGTKG